MGWALGGAKPDGRAPHYRVIQQPGIARPTLAGSLAPPSCAPLALAF
jgi:hypothetical protein